MAIQIPQFTLGLAATTLNNSSANTAPVDFNVGNTDAAVFHIQLGDQTPGATINTCKLQESDDNSTWVDVTNGSLITGAAITLANTDDNTSIVLACKRTGRRRYVRVQIATTTATALPITYIAAAGLNSDVNDPINPALRSVFVP